MEAINKLQNYEVYTNTQALNDLKVKARNDTKEALKPVAQQFESVFVEQILKENRKVKLDDGWLDGDKTDFYKDWHDKQFAQSISANGGIGLAKTIVEQLSPNPALAVNSGTNSTGSPVTSMPVKPPSKSPDPSVGILPVHKPVNSEDSVVGILPVRKPDDATDTVVGILPVGRTEKSADPVVGILPIQKTKEIVGTDEQLKANTDMSLKLKGWYPLNIKITDEVVKKTSDPATYSSEPDEVITSEKKNETNVIRDYEASSSENAAKAWFDLTDITDKKLATNYLIMKQSLAERLSTQDQLRLRSLQA